MAFWPRGSSRLRAPRGFHASEYFTGAPWYIAREYVASASCHRGLAGADRKFEHLIAPGTLATNAHMQLTVEAHATCYPQGLIVAHEPARVAIFFSPDGMGPRTLSYDEAASALRCCADPLAAMLYTEKDGLGHIEALERVDVPVALEVPVVLNFTGMEPRMFAGMQGLGGCASPADRTPVHPGDLFTLEEMGFPTGVAAYALRVHPRSLDHAATLSAERMQF